MMRMFGCVALAGLCALMPEAGLQARAEEPITRLAGRWAGPGVLTPASGPSENFKCVITYFANDSGSQVRQNLRCRGATHRFDAAADLDIADRRVKGRWTDNIYSLSGTVHGTVTDTGFDVVLLNPYFTAKMTVVSSKCEQSIVVVPEKQTDMKELAAVLKKC